MVTNSDVRTALGHRQDKRPHSLQVESGVLVTSTSIDKSCVPQLSTRSASNSCHCIPDGAVVVFLDGPNLPHRFCYGLIILCCGWSTGTKMTSAWKRSTSGRKAMAFCQTDREIITSPEQRGSQQTRSKVESVRSAVITNSDSSGNNLSSRLWLFSRC